MLQCGRTGQPPAGRYSTRMSIDLTSYGAPVQQVRPPTPGVTSAEGQTLTLQLRMAADAGRADPMSGLLSVRDAIAASSPGDTLRLNVAAAPGTPLTITF